MTPNHQQNIVKLINRHAYKYHTWDIFRDFCEMGALSISNVVDRGQYDKREERYLQIIGRYDQETQAIFPQLLGELTEALECGPRDVLGRVFHELEIADKWKGQYFTPNEVSLMMAMALVGDGTEVRRHIAERGFITVSEPAVGGGALVLAFAKAMATAGMSYQQQLHVTAVDVDPTCVHMTYLQLALCHIPAIVVHGNSLSLAERSHWYTPAHILDGWTWRLRRTAHLETQSVEEPDIHPDVLEEVQALIAQTETPSALPVANRAGREGQLVLF